MLARQGASLFLRGTRAEKARLCVAVVNTPNTDPVPLGVVREMLQQVGAVLSTLSTPWEYSEYPWEYS